MVKLQGEGKRTNKDKRDGSVFNASAGSEVSLFPPSLLWRKTGEKEMDGGLKKINSKGQTG